MHSIKHWIFLEFFILLISNNKHTFTSYARTIRSARLCSTNHDRNENQLNWLFSRLKLSLRPTRNTNFHVHFWFTFLLLNCLMHTFLFDSNNFTFYLSKSKVKIKLIQSKHLNLAATPCVWFRLLCRCCNFATAKCVILVRPGC